ncbi:MAG: hypothetical protein ABFD91_04560 [Anaerohalosphaeraceae bacterium]
MNLLKKQSITKSSMLICICILTMTMNAVCADSVKPKALVITSRDSATDITQAFKKELEQAGYQAGSLSDANITGSSLKDVDLVFIQDSQTLAVNNIDAILEFLKSGGDIVALRAPLWGQAQRDSYLALPAQGEPTRILPSGLKTNMVLNPQALELEKWKRSTNDWSSLTTYSVIDDANIVGAKALNVHITNRTGWDTYLSPPIEKPFPKGYELTIFWAKGDARTVELAVEWQEKNGARWIAAIPLTENWQPYILKPEDFHYWRSETPANPDRLTLSQASRICFGLAATHVVSFGGGTHNYQIGPVYTAKPDDSLRRYLSVGSIPKLDALSENYKFFQCSDVAALSVRTDQSILGQCDLPAAENILSCHPRASGDGFAKDRAWRWIPLMDAKSTDGKWRGNPASMLINFDGPYKGSTWVSFTVHDQNWYKNPSVQKAVSDMVKRISNRVYMVDGGANFYTYFENQPVELGLDVANFNKTSNPNLTYDISVCAQSNPAIFASKGLVDLDQIKRKQVKETWNPKDWPNTGYKVSVKLLDNGKVIDSLEHNINCWTPSTNKQFITVSDGKFFLNGKRWRANGVNYMPSSGIACEDNIYFDSWFNATSYDPEIIDRDLDIVKGLGMNAVSIFLEHMSMSSQNLLDFFYKARQRDLKINLSLRPGTPMDFQWDKISEMMKYYRIAENDTVFAYDLAWEPAFGGHNDRQKFDTQWEAWIIERYGSIENAQNDWGFKICRDETGKVTNPLNEYTIKDGPWTPMVSAYRRFLDTLLYEKYGQARRLVHTLDTNHLVSFRMADAGNPTNNSENIAYDWPYLAAAVDIFEPEAYGRLGGWEQIKPGMFASYYANWASSRLPLVWAEVGTTAWLRSRMIGDPEHYEYQADFYKNFYQMMISSGADGVFFWWYPGGFRPVEQSDYGIVNPDGTDRPVTKIIREYGQKLLNGKDLNYSEPKFVIDRDRHSAGLSGIYSEYKDEFWKSQNSGKCPLLVTEATGSDTSNCPLTAIGNKAFTGSNPPKYIDGFIDTVNVKIDDGQWQTVSNNEAVKVKPGSSVFAKLSYTNLGEAAWFSSNDSNQMGIVGIVIDGKERKFVPVHRPLKHLESDQTGEILLTKFGKEPVSVTLSFEAKKRARFGSKFTLKFESID